MFVFYKKVWNGPEPPPPLWKISTLFIFFFFEGFPNVHYKIACFGCRKKHSLREAFNKKNHKTYGKFHMLGGRGGQVFWVLHLPTVILILVVTRPDTILVHRYRSIWKYIEIHVYMKKKRLKVFKNVI